MGAKQQGFYFALAPDLGSSVGAVIESGSGVLKFDIHVLRANWKVREIAHMISLVQESDLVRYGSSRRSLCDYGSLCSRSNVLIHVVDGKGLSEDDITRIGETLQNLDFHKM